MLLTLKETAEELKVCPATVMRMVANGEISETRCCKVGRAWRFDLEGIISDLMKKEYAKPVY